MLRRASGLRGGGPEDEEVAVLCPPAEEPPLLAERPGPGPGAGQDSDQHGPERNPGVFPQEAKPETRGGGT